MVVSLLFPSIIIDVHVDRASQVGESRMRLPRHGEANNLLINHWPASKRTKQLALGKEGWPKDPSLTSYLQCNIKLWLSDFAKVY